MVVRLTISGSAETIRVVKTVVGFLQLMGFSFDAQTWCEKNEWKNYVNPKAL
ncbi:MAG: hypothetical protein WKF36_03780 [Candidatus Nitrosocosmicus sp.]